jgi:hypothetical protein
MADIILHRRSFDTGSVPTTESLGVAQFAINVPDGKVFIHKSSSIAESIISVVTTDSITTGSITLTATASAALFIGTFTGSFSGVSTNAQTASLVSGSQPFVDFNTSSAAPTWKSGRVFWDNVNDTLAIYSSESAVTLQVGQENWTRVFNNTGATITDGTVVRLTGTHGDVPQVVKAAAIQVSGAMNFENQVLGVVTHNIGAGSFGMVTTQGLVRGLNTSAFNDGDTLYISSSAGLLTNVAPQAPFEIIPIGQVVKAGPGGSGIIYVTVSQPSDFSDLSSVKVEGNYTLGDLFAYQRSGSVNVWRHTTDLTGSYSISGSLQVSNSLVVIGSQRVTGSVAITGSLVVFTSLTGSPELQVLNTGVNLGNQLSDIHRITGSVGITGSFSVIGNQQNTGSIYMWQSASVSGTNIFGTASNAISASNATTASYVQFQYNRELHVSVAGSDSTGDGTFLFPFRTIGKALDSASSAVQIVVHPGTYEESPTVSGSATNVTITAANGDLGSITEISGSLTVNSYTGATKVLGIAINNIIHTGSQNLYLQNVTVRSSLSKTGNGYLEADKISCQSPSTFSVTAPGTVVVSNSLLGVVTVNNASANVNLSNNIEMISPTCTAGTLFIDGGVIYSQHVDSGSVISSAGAVVVLANLVSFTPSNTPARIRLNAASGYSIQNVAYDKANSTLGVSLGNKTHFQHIQADAVTGSSFTGSFIGTLTGSADTASFANSGFTINSSSIFSFARTSSAIGVNSFSIATGSTRGSVLNYTVNNTSNARTGQVMTSWVGSNIVFNETHTPDIGSTSGVSFTSSLSGANVVYNFGTATAGWNIEFLVTHI